MATVGAGGRKVSSADSNEGDETTYGIREVADRFHMQTSTLRYYEDQGLLMDVGRDSAGQRRYRECHISRLKSICCFKHAGMSIEDLKRFFAYEGHEREHIDDMIALVRERRGAIETQLAAIEEARRHVLRKQHFYEDIKASLANGTSWPDWNDYRNATFGD